MGFHDTIPGGIVLTTESHSNLDAMTRVGELEVFYTARGYARYSLEIWHDGLQKYQVIKGDNVHVVQQKAQARLTQWEEMWARKEAAAIKREEREHLTLAKEEKKAQAADETLEAQEALARLENTLSHTLEIDDAVDWEELKIKDNFGTPKPDKPQPPSPPTLQKTGREPNRSERKYQYELGFLDKLFSSRQAAKEKEADLLFRYDQDFWSAEKARHEADYEKKKGAHSRMLVQLEEEYGAALASWEEERARYLQNRNETNLAIEAKKQQYVNKDLEAIRDYCDLVLSNSSYPDYFPQSYELDFNRDTEILIIDYQLPSRDHISTAREVIYVQSQDEFRRKDISKRDFNVLYDSLLYQIALRTLHECFEADVVDALSAVVFNGYVQSVDPATGHESNPCILSVQASKAEFLNINLGAIDPKACFKKLKGVGSSRLHSLTPVAPIMWMNREDKRFVGSYAVADFVDEGYNLAAMDWEDFEHLVRELFEKEFAEAGGEVRVTQSSRDGGIDAVIFDPDPIRGGKIVIQAKRYTNTVGVAAIRDLYGCVLNEGANKGILVTTSDYGPDSYAFAKGKPLTLLSGSNLLHLLEKHGHRAKIDLAEARRLAIEDQ